MEGFIDPADAIAACKRCKAGVGEPCVSRPGEQLRPGAVHIGRRIARLLMTAKATATERVRVEQQLVAEVLAARRRRRADRRG